MYLVVLRLVCHVIFIYLCSVGAHVFFFFFFNDTATTEIYTLSLHDALPIWELVGLSSYLLIGFWYHKPSAAAAAKKAFIDRKSTRLNSSHSQISYAVFCLKKKKNSIHPQHPTTSLMYVSVASIPHPSSVRRS